MVFRNFSIRPTVKKIGLQMNSKIFKAKHIQLCRQAVRILAKLVLLFSSLPIYINHFGLEAKQMFGMFSNFLYKT